VSTLPWMKFYPGDWLKGTRRLTLAEKGALADALAYAAMNAPARGTVSGSLAEWARMLGCEGEETRRVLEALAAAGHAAFSAGREAVSVAFSSLVGEEAERKSHLDSQLRYKARRKKRVDGKLMDRSQTSEVRGQTSEVRDGSSGEESREPAPAATPAPVEVPARAPVGDAGPGADGQEGPAPEATGAPAEPRPRPRFDGSLPLAARKLAIAVFGSVYMAEGMLREAAGACGALRTAAWLLVLVRRRSEGKVTGAAAAYWRSLWKKSQAEPPDWALAEAKAMLAKDAAELPEPARKLIGEIAGGFSAKA